MRLSKINQFDLVGGEFVAEYADETQELVVLTYGTDGLSASIADAISTHIASGVALVARFTNEQSRSVAIAAHPAAIMFAGDTAVGIRFECNATDYRYALTVLSYVAKEKQETEEAMADTIKAPDVNNGSVN